MRIDILCSGSKGNSVLFRTETTCVLLDCGAPNKKYLKQAFDSVGASFQDVQAVLLTHTHSDHIRYLSTFANVPVYTRCSPAIKDSKRQPIALDVHPFAYRSSIEIGDLKVSSLCLSHDSGPTLGFLLQHQGRKAVYITDTGYISQQTASVIGDADVYIFESNHDVQMLMETDRPMWLKQRILCDTGHLCNQTASQALSRLAGPHTRQIVLAHLSEEANTPQAALETLQQTFWSREVSLEGIQVDTASQDQVLTIDLEALPQPAFASSAATQQTAARKLCGQEKPDKQEEQEEQELAELMEDLDF